MSEPKGLAKRFEVRLERTILETTVVEIEATTEEEAKAIAEGLGEDGLILDWDTGEPLGHVLAIEAEEAQ